MIRTYRSSDLHRCRALWAEMVQSHRDLYDDSSIGGNEPGLAFDEHLSRVGSDTVWVAIEEEEIVGMVSLIHDGEQAEVEPIVVSSRHRGRGIGRALLQHAVEEARKSGVICLSVKPVARNEEAVSFFYDAGFRTLGHIQQFMWLGPETPGQWKPGPVVFGKTFEY